VTTLTRNTPVVPLVNIPNAPIVISESELVDMVKAIKGNTFVTFKSKTIPALYAGNPFDEVFKYSHVNGCLGFSYEKAINKIRKAECEAKGVPFEYGTAEPHAWAEHEASAIVHNADMTKKYLVFKVQSVVSPPVYVEEALPEFVEGVEGGDNDVIENIIDKSELVPFLRPVKEEKVIYRNYGIASILSIKMNGKEYTIDR